MASVAALGQLFPEAPGIREHARRLKYWSQRSSFTMYVACHSILTHIQPHSLHVLHLLQFFNSWQTPGACQPRVLMGEISVVYHLVPVQGTTELHVALGFLQIIIKFLQPCRIVAKDMLIQFVQDTKVCAWRAPYNQQGIVTLHNFPSSLSVAEGVEVETITQVQGTPR